MTSGTNATSSIGWIAMGSLSDGGRSRSCMESGEAADMVAAAQVLLSFV
jgi:hypothetical protein